MPPMNPQDLAQMQTMIDGAVDRAVDRVIKKVIQPLRDDLDILKNEAKDLEADSRKHSGTHKELVKDTSRISQNDLKQDAAIAQILTKVSATDARVGAVEEKLDNAAKERANTATNVQSLVDSVSTAEEKFTKRYPKLSAAIGLAILAAVDFGARWLAAH